LARNVDPDGQRSIGVLTKPDKVELGTETGILEILAGRKYALRMGYFIVRTPNPTELDEIAVLDPAASFSKVGLALGHMACAKTQTPSSKTSVDQRRDV
jgi:hypothetical protein